MRGREWLPDRYLVFVSLNESRVRSVKGFTFKLQDSLPGKSLSRGALVEFLQNPKEVLHKVKTVKILRNKVPDDQDQPKDIERKVKKILSDTSFLFLPFGCLSRYCKDFM